MKFKQDLSNFFAFNMLIISIGSKISKIFSPFSMQIMMYISPRPLPSIFFLYLFGSFRKSPYLCTVVIGFKPVRKVGAPAMEHD